jgi:exopolysaccharide biosynthesis polyprenyl glycosylphosphotransferase
MSERGFLLRALDLVALNASLLLSLSLRFRQPVDLGMIVRQPVWFIVLTLLWLVAAQTFDSYEPRIIGLWPESAIAVIKAGMFTAVVYLLIPRITPPLPASRIALVSFPLLVVAVLLAGRALYVLAFPKPLFERRTLILGVGSAAQTIAQLLTEARDRSYRVIGFVDDNPAAHDIAASIIARKAPVLSVVDRQTLIDLVVHDRLSTLILAVTHRVNSDLMQAILDCMELGVDVVPLPVLYEMLTGRVPLEYIGDNWYAALPLHHPGTGALLQVTKRLMDILLSSAGLVLLALLLPFISLAIYLDSPGPIFYAQERVGKGGRVFRAYKFRSMIPDAEQGRPMWAQENDSRISRVGRILRATHVDEFPQFLNILKGEMSAVGPRPERPEFVEQLAKEIPFFRLRHAVKPGMAGWALVRYGYVSTKDEAVVRLEYDLYYIKHQSFWLDVVILLKTFLRALALKGR